MNTALFFLCLATLGGPAPVRDPGAVMVVVDDVKSSSFRIADGQKLVVRLVGVLKERVGYEGVVYKGVLSSMRKMNALVKEDVGAQQRNRIFYEAAVKNAPFKVVAKYRKHRRSRKRKKTAQAFGKKAQDLELVCIDNLSGKKLHHFKKSYQDFEALLEGMKLEMQTFCPEIKAKIIEKKEEPAEIKKPLKPWTPPPRRD